MKLIPLITAILVSLGLYYLVIDRDTLLTFARGEEVEEIQDTETASDFSQPIGERRTCGGKPRWRSCPAQSGAGV